MAGQLSTSSAAPSSIRSDGVALLGRLMSPRAHKLLTVLTVIGLIAFFNSKPSHSTLKFTFPRTPHIPQSPPTLSPPPTSLPRSITGQDESLSSFLDARFPLVPDLAETLTVMPDGSQMGPHLWITMADRSWVKTGALALHTFVQALNRERSLRYGPKTRETVVVTLCLEKWCLEECENQGMYCYGGFTFSKPPLVSVLCGGP